MIEKLKELWAGGFLILTTAWLLLHLILIELRGIVSIGESNKWILWTEIILASLILILAAERFIKDWREK